MAGVGDARPDVPFLTMVGMACAPSNAVDEVKSICSFVSDKPDAEATMEFIDHIIAHNRAFARCQGGMGRHDAT